MSADCQLSIVEADVKRRKMSRATKCLTLIFLISVGTISCEPDELVMLEDGKGSNRNKTISVSNEESNMMLSNSTWFKDLRDRRRGLYLDDPMEMERNVRQNIYNFYHIEQQSDYRRPRPPPLPPYYDGSPPASYDPYDYRDPTGYYRPHPPYYQRPPYGSPYITPTPSPASTVTTTTPSLSPLGYMLIDNYRTPFGSYSRPLAFFKT